MSHDIIQHLPSIFHDVKDFQELANTSNIELDNLADAINTILNNNFVNTSDISSIQRREKMLNIKADPTTETIEFRKKRILNRYQTKPPFTIEWLQQQLDSLVGVGRAIATVDVQNFILSVVTSIDDTPLFKEVEYTIKNVKPANLIYQQKTGVNNVIGVEEHLSRHTLLPQTGLGTTWHLGVSPFYSLDTEVVIK